MPLQSLLPWHHISPFYPNIASVPFILILLRCRLLLYWYELCPFYCTIVQQLTFNPFFRSDRIPQRLRNKVITVWILSICTTLFSTCTMSIIFYILWYSCTLFWIKSSVLKYNKSWGTDWFIPVKVGPMCNIHSPLKQQLIKCATNNSIYLEMAIISWAYT